MLPRSQMYFYALPKTPFFGEVLILFGGINDKVDKYEST